MEGFPARGYGTGGADHRPLFGETSARDRIINLVVGGLTTLLLVVTLISAFVFPQLPPKPVNVFFAFCISLCCISAGILVSTATFAMQAFESTVLNKTFFMWCCLFFYILLEKLSCLHKTS
ncbi:transmembrane protein 243 isoform X1 [Pseudopipra pipra]|uniref:transmembrane protein 243 isoform X1 n=1 Tax=Pseudopipra pipra TaxID=415032 RepID=UPI00313A24CF